MGIVVRYPMASIHRVVAGECLASLASRYGFASADSLYNDPANAKLRALRPDPGLLAPGDEVAIPAHTPLKTSCAAGQRHRFVWKRPTVLLRLKLEVGRPSHYRLRVRDETFTGDLSETTVIEHRVPADVTSGIMEVWADGIDPEASPEQVMRSTLRIGNLDPLDTIAGLQGRLFNLGEYHGPVDGRESPLLRSSLEHFQRRLGIVVTGELDAPTRDALHTRHDQAGGT